MMALLLSLVFTPLLAQDASTTKSSSSGGIAFGARVGSTFSYFSNNYRFEGGNPGLQAGGIVNYDLSDKIQIAGSVDYVQQRGSLGSSTNSAGSLFVIKDNYLTLHNVEAGGMLGYKLPLPFLGDAAPYLQGGAAIAYNLGAWNKYTARYYTPGFSEAIEVTGKENVSNVSDELVGTWMVGLRFQSDLNSGLFSKMLIDIRFKSTFDPVVRPYSFNGSAKELGIRSLSASLGFLF